ncbi:MAG: hypothetical protein DRI57_33295 [Deltaproteobacteria bacterium]|nr:MAG: hypothetical protein DRI57_33295 [Deltaproteobacteria bacterium]
MEFAICYLGFIWDLEFGIYLGFGIYLEFAIWGLFFCRTGFVTPSATVVRRGEHFGRGCKPRPALSYPEILCRTGFATPSATVVRRGEHFGRGCKPRPALSYPEIRGGGPTCHRKRCCRPRPALSYPEIALVGYFF